MKQKILFILAVCLLGLSSCRLNVVYIQFTEDELLWTPYKNYELLVFENDSLQFDTLEVNNPGNLQAKVMCEMPIICSGTEYVPASLAMNFNKDNYRFLNLNLYKDENDDSFYGSFDNNYDSVNINDFSNKVDLSIDEFVYRDVLLFEFQNGSNTGIMKVYYKEGIGLLKYEDGEDRIWFFKERI